MKEFTFTAEEAWRLGVVKLEKVATWDADDLRRFCIENELYTAGDSTKYDMMLNFVRKNPCTEWGLRLVATDIVAHSYTGNGDVPLSLYPEFHCQDDVSFMLDEIVENVVKFK